MNPWTMQRLVAIRCEELARIAERARVNRGSRRDRRPLDPERGRPYAVPSIVDGEVLLRLAAVVAAGDA